MADDAKDKKETADPEAEEATGGGKKKLVLIVAIAGVLVLGGAGAGFVLLRGSGDGTETEAEAEGESHERADAETLEHDEAGSTEAEAEAHEPEGAVGKMYALEPFIVNIADRERDRYLKIKAELELVRPEVANEVEARLPQLRDMVISLLGSKSFEEIRSMEGKDLLREELLQRINALLTTGKARRIFFTEFVVQ
ncbi:MAG: flagellar basal body-associated protein FliL [Myxococcota bacterium]